MEPIVAKAGRRDWPKRVIVGNVAVKVYRQAHKTSASGFTYVVTYRQAGGRAREKFADPARAVEEARLKATQLNAGRIEAADVSVHDRDLLREAKRVCGDYPVLAALKEWAEAHRLTKGQIMQAAQAWHARSAGNFSRVTVEKAVDDFIAAKEKAKKQGERTYRAKLDPLKKAFPGQHLDAISAKALDAYLQQWEDGTTRNDLRKRAVALWRWAYSRNHLPRGAPLEIEQTERAREEPTEIGIIDARTFKRLLEFVRANRPELLPALVLAGFCGIRADEIHGKREDRSKRQLWEDIRLDEKFVRVTVAKRNTPAWRFVPLCDAAIAWLNLCEEKKGMVCDPGAMEKVRLVARAANFELPENCFRHSFISYRITATDGNKPQVATEAGNSVREIDRRYRVPVTKAEALAWFAVMPTPA